MLGGAALEGGLSSGLVVRPQGHQRLWALRLAAWQPWDNVWKSHLRCTKSLDGSGESSQGLGASLM